MYETLHDLIEDIHKESRIKKRNFSPSKNDVYPSSDEIASKIEIYFNLGYNINPRTIKSIRNNSRLNMRDFSDFIIKKLTDENILDNTTQTDGIFDVSALDEIPLFSSVHDIKALDFFHTHYHNLGRDVHEGHIAFHDPALHIQLRADGAFERGEIRAFKAVVDEGHAAIAKALALPEYALHRSEVRQLLAVSLSEQEPQAAQGTWVQRIQSENTPSLAVPPLPDKAPRLWKDREKGETRPDFIQSTYGIWLGADVPEDKQFSRGLYDALDPTGYKALTRWEDQGNELPAGFGLPERQSKTTPEEIEAFLKGDKPKNKRDYSRVYSAAKRQSGEWER